MGIQTSMMNMIFKKTVTIGLVALLVVSGLVVAFVNAGDEKYMDKDEERVIGVEEIEQTFGMEKEERIPAEIGAPLPYHRAPFDVGSEFVGPPRYSMGPSRSTGTSSNSSVGGALPVPAGDHVEHDPIRIDSNADFDAAHGVTGGNGTEADPWVIEGYDIDGGGYGYGIYIGNTTDYFVIRNCYLHNASENYDPPHFINSGLHLYFVENGKVGNNTASSNGGSGIYLRDSGNNTIYGNTVSSNIGNGINLDHSDSNIIFNNTASSHGGGGIYMYSSSNNSISKNTASNNDYGIYIDLASSNIISNNTVSSNNDDGIHLSWSSNNSISNNIASSNSFSGIRLRSSSNNSISNNTASSNNFGGIHLYSSDFNTIFNNTASNNRYGIFLPSSNSNDISNNTASSNNDDGIYLSWSNSNDISNNTASLNNYYGISLYSSSMNTIYHNNIINNINQAYDDGDNKWNASYPVGGNYWSDYTGVDEYSGPNQDQPGSDGIGDTPYLNISGGLVAQDNYPLMELIGVLPSVTGTIPSDGAENVKIDVNIIVVFSGSLNTSDIPTLEEITSSDSTYTFVGWNTTNMENDTASWTHTVWPSETTIILKVSNYSDLDGKTGENYSWSFTTEDATPPTSSVDTISPYWKNTSPMAVSASATDSNSGVRNATLYYRYSPDNSSWNGWTDFSTDTSSPWEWSFDFPDGGEYYEFYSIASDDANNTESAPGSADTICGYDSTPPTSMTDTISPSKTNESSITITYTRSDGLSGVKNVTLSYSYSADGTSYGSWEEFGTKTSPTFGDFSFVFPDGDGYYQFRTRAWDNASNQELEHDGNDTWIRKASPTQQDTIPPRITDLTSETPTTGDGFAFTANVSDDVGVATVWINYWFDSGSPNNVSMIKSGDNWTYDLDVTSDATVLHYNYRAKDDSSNWATTADYTLDVLDNDAPSITDNSQTAGTTEDAFNFNALVTDNINVSNVYVEYWFGSDSTSSQNFSMNNPQGDVWNYDITLPSDSTYDLHYIISAVDYSDNWASTGTVDITVTDDDVPDGEHGGFFWWMLVIIGAIVVAVMLVFFFRKKKGDEEPEDMRDEFESNEEEEIEDVGI